jgi:hypothetical protein
MFIGKRRADRQNCANAGMWIVGNREWYIMRLARRWYQDEWKERKRNVENGQCATPDEDRKRKDSR